jgi:hypothetical protein
MPSAVQQAHGVPAQYTRWYWMSPSRISHHLDQVHLVAVRAFARALPGEPGAAGEIAGPEPAAVVIYYVL